MELTCHTFEVFLSFRGRDIRSSFVSLLSDEFNFTDANTEIYMPICSENNASNKWCLREIVRSLTTKHCSCLEIRLSHLSEMRHLTKLTLRNCEKLREIHCLDDLESVKHLVIRDCSSLESLPNLSKLGLLERLHIEKCKKLKEIDGLESVFLRFLHIGYCNSLERLGINPLGMNRLEYICIEFCASLREIHNVSGNPRLLNNSIQVKPRDIGGITSLAEQDSDSSSSNNSVNENGLIAAQCSVAGLDNHHLQSYSESAATAAKAFLKHFFSAGIESLADSSVDLVPVVAAAKVLLRIKRDHFWEEFCSKVDETCSSYKRIVESLEGAENARAKYGKLKELAVEMRNDYGCVKSRMDEVQATKEKAVLERDSNTTRARIVELENTVIQADQQLQVAGLERRVLVTGMKELVGVMRAMHEEIRCWDAACDASHARFNLLKAQWAFWAAHLD